MEVFHNQEVPHPTGVGFDVVCLVLATTTEASTYARHESTAERLLHQIVSMSHDLLVVSFGLIHGGNQRLSCLF
jgi:hypothetical protein